MARLSRADLTSANSLLAWLNAVSRAFIVASHFMTEARASVTTEERGMLAGTFNLRVETLIVWD